MKPPDREATREALDWFEGTMGPPLVVKSAARAWSRIAPDADGEWPDKVVEQLARGLAYHHNPDQPDDEPIGLHWKSDAKAVLAELVRLAEGSTE